MPKTAIVAGALTVTALLSATPAAAAGSSTWRFNSVTVKVGHGQWNGAPGCLFSVKVNFNHGPNGELRLYRWRPGDHEATASDHIDFPRAARNAVYTLHSGASNGERVYFKLYLYTFGAPPKVITKAYRLVDHDTNPRTITPWTCHA